MAESLKQLRQRNELLLQAAGEGIYGLDSEGITTFVNPAAARMLGWEAEDLIGQPMHKLHHHSHPDGSHYPREECPIYAAFKDGVVHEVCDEVFWRKDGSCFPVEYTSTPVIENNKLVGAVVVFRDVTERKNAEDALRGSEERFRKLFNYSSDGIFLIDVRNECYLNVNPRACKMLGYSRDELLSMKVSDIHPHDLKQFISFSESVVADGYARTEVLSCLAKDGEKIAAEITASTFLENNGERQLIMASVRDIRERKQAEEALRIAHQEVECLKERLQAENIYLQEEIRTEHNFEEIIGSSKALKKVLHQVEQVAETDATVLILGETGTGKELFTRAVHNLSPRKNRPLVKVNCASLPPTLIESELFGHEKGSFTGALSRKTGRFELAHEGTIFLDEIGDLPLELQAKLLRILQEGEFERLGNTNTLSVDVRVIAATNRDLEKEVSNGKFREDLFYRLNVFPLVIPPLRERKKDLPVLVQTFVSKFCKRLGKHIDIIPRDVMDRIEAYNWPGNVRELENIIERAVIVSSGNTLQINDSLVAKTTPDKNTTHATLQDAERDHIVNILKQTDWVISGHKGAAKILDMNPNTLRSRMQKLGIYRSTSSS